LPKFNVLKGKSSKGSVNKKAAKKPNQTESDGR